MRYSIGFALLLSAAAVSSSAVSAAADGIDRLPTGVRLHPSFPSIPLGNMPLAVRLSPDGKRAVVALGGFRNEGIQVVDLATRSVVQTIQEPSVFVGLAFAPDGRTLYVSGGNEDMVYLYDWRDGQARRRGEIRLAAKEPKKRGTRFPAGLAVSSDGRFLYVAENLGDKLAVVDLTTEAVVERVAADRYPYEVAIGPRGDVYLSCWGAGTVMHYAPLPEGRLAEPRRLLVGRHPSALLLNDSGTRLFATLASVDRISVVDLQRDRLLTSLSDPPPYGAREGSTPDALALSQDGTRLFVAEADNNCVAIFGLSVRTAGRGREAGPDRLLGRVPVEWYPTALARAGDALVVVTGKGRGTGANPTFLPGKRTPENSLHYTLGQTEGTLAVLPLQMSTTVLRSSSRRVAAANGWTAPGHAAGLPKFRHVLYIIKENRTYDQIFGDVADGDGDPALVYFPRPVSPNHHALAARFGLFDRFFVNAEVSADGHNWSTAAYATDYVEKTVPSEYGGRGRSYDYEGTNRDRLIDESKEDDAAEPAAGYLWNAAIAAGVTLRDYGEFVTSAKDVPQSPPFEGLRATKVALRPYINPDYPGFDLDIRDQHRADVWLRDLELFSARGSMPRLQILRLPNDHTSAAKAGKPTPAASMADNDLALGRIVSALSKSRFWRDTVVFVLEDDAQDGPDHVDSHRSALMVISAWSRPGTVHRFVNSTDVLATIEHLLGLRPMSQFDLFGRPLAGIFASAADLAPYDPIIPSVSLDEKNREKGPDAVASATLNLERADAADEDLFNRILWRTVKGEDPYPGPVHRTRPER
jgi:DNA-binding beta-propeller fold protein YncE